MNEASSKQSMLCPVCRVQLTLSERQSVEIDYCPQCRGVWLDRGELDKIIERSERVEEPRGRLSPNFDRQHSDDRRGHGYSGHHGGKRRRGFLSELFD
ncbi:MULTISPECIES: zf-TFIIB domain-containing protein [Sphingomonadaceae]|uniref:TFIIB-type zinc ribbon-containing protein n=1 Tax=Sphingomonadaceae TaxID=41297 RepID=UPI0009D926D5|nr:MULTISPECIES: zf-TFIIB domain-containing protein [Sphingomonadaceae]